MGDGDEVVRADIDARSNGTLNSLLRLIRYTAGSCTTDRCDDYIKVTGTRAPIEAILHSNGDVVVLNYGTNKDSVPAVYSSLDIASANLRGFRNTATTSATLRM